MVETLNQQGHDVVFQSVPAEVFDNFFPGAREIGEMMSYFEAPTCFGPHADDKIALAREVSTTPPTSLADWAREHLPVEGGAP